MARPRAFDHDQAVAAAAELFRERGYEATSIRDLTAHLGVSTSSLYAAFGDKDGVFMAALRHAADGDRAMVLAQLDGAPTLSQGLRDLYRNAIDGYLAAPSPFLSLTLRAGLELADRRPEVLNFLRAHLDELIALLAERLRAADARGELSLSLAAEDLARYLLLSVFNLMFVVKLHRGRAELDAYVQAVLMAVLPQPGPSEVPS